MFLALAWSPVLLTLCAIQLSALRSMYALFVRWSGSAASLQNEILSQVRAAARIAVQLMEVALGKPEAIKFSFRDVLLFAILIMVTANYLRRATQVLHKPRSP